MSDKKYNTTVIALWTTRNGHLWSMDVDAKAYDQVTRAMDDGFKPGCRFIIKTLSEDSRSKFKDPEKAPTHFLEIISPESLEEFKNKQTSRRDSL